MGGGGGGGAKLDIEEYELVPEGLETLVFVEREFLAPMFVPEAFLADLLELPPVDFPDCFELIDEVLGVLPVAFTVLLLVVFAVVFP